MRPRTMTVLVSAAALIALTTWGIARRPLLRWLGPGRPTLVVLVTIDTLRADHLPHHGYPRATAPFLTRLAAAGTVFENAFSHSSHTAPSHASLFTARHPTEHGVTVNGATLDASLPTLAGAFAAAGYETAAFTSVGFLQGLRAGFDVFEYRRLEEAEAAADGPVLYRPAAATVARVAGWLDVRAPEQPLFLWVHLFDVHEWERGAGDLAGGPDLGPPAGADLVRHLVAVDGLDPTALPAERHPPAALLESYDARIRAVDDALASLYAACGRTPIGGDALWIVTADHGEGLGSHGYAGHGRCLYDEQLHVPLVLHASDGRYAGRRVPALVRHADLFPTLADLLDLPAPALPEAATPALTGRSLRSLLEGDPDAPRVLLAERRSLDPATLEAGWEAGEVVCLRTAEVKYIHHSDGPDECYDLRVDPLEQVDRIGDAPRAAVLARLVEAQLRAMKAAGAGEPARVDPAHRDELRQFGYLDGG